MTNKTTHLKSTFNQSSIFSESEDALSSVSEVPHDINNISDHQHSEEIDKTGALDQSDDSDQGNDEMSERQKRF